MTDLVDTVIAIDASVASGGEMTYVDISGSFSNAGLTEGFYWREIGLFVANPEAPDEREHDILYCYQNAYDTANFIPAASVETVEKHITIPLVVADADNISCLLDHSFIYATKQDIEEHNADSAAHPSLRQDIDALDDTLTGYIKVTDASFTTLQANINAANESISDHEQNTTRHTTAAEKATWNGKADPEDITDAINTHNVDTTAHPDIRKALQAITALVYNIDVVPSQNGSLTYTGSAQGPSWNSYNPDTLTLGGVTSATNAGTYTATFTPKGDYHWSDGSTGAKEVTWTISRAAITTTPSQSGSLTYTGSILTSTWSNYDSTKLTIGGTTSAVNAGSNTATFLRTYGVSWDGSSTIVWSRTDDAASFTNPVPYVSGATSYTRSSSQTATSLAPSQRSTAPTDGSHTISRTRPCHG